MAANVGRPRDADSRARTEEFLRLLAEGVALKEAARRARVKPERALVILDPIVQPIFTKAA